MAHHHPLPFFEELESYLKELKSKGGFRFSGWPLAVLGLCLLAVSFIFMPSVVRFALSLALFLAPVWLPFLIVAGAWTAWVILKRSEYIAKQNVILLEIKPPRSHAKTPLAMEAVLSGLHHGPGEGTWYKQYILGQVRPWWSLEIVSLEGQVHFYIWTRAGFRRIIESQIYSQYPGAQVVEAVDYTRTISAIPGEWAMWGCDFKKSREDPYPIKTYVEYGLDKAQKEFEQIDPLSNLVEYMGSMAKGEYLWIQLIVRIHKGEKFQAGVEFKKELKHMKDWKEFGKAIVDDIRKSTREPYIDPVSGKEIPGFPNPTKGQMEAMAAIERNTSKLAFDIGIRGLYIAANGRFDGINISGLTGIFKQFNSEGWNAIGPTGGMTIFDDYPWEIGSEKLKNLVLKDLVEAYRRRQFFHDPFKGDGNVMSTEEIATLFHIPSAAVVAPGLPRIQSATSEAPVNLPT